MPRGFVACGGCAECYRQAAQVRRSCASRTLRRRRGGGAGRTSYGQRARALRTRCSSNRHACAPLKPLTKSPGDAHVRAHPGLPACHPPCVWHRHTGTSLYVRAARCVIGLPHNEFVRTEALVGERTRPNRQRRPCRRTSPGNIRAMRRAAGRARRCGHRVRVQSSRGFGRRAALYLRAHRAHSRAERRLCLQTRSDAARSVRAGPTVRLLVLLDCDHLARRFVTALQHHAVRAFSYHADNFVLVHVVNSRVGALEGRVHSTSGMVVGGRFERGKRSAITGVRSRTQLQTPNQRTSSYMRRAATRKRARGLLGCLAATRSAVTRPQHCCQQFSFMSSATCVRCNAANGPPPSRIRHTGGVGTCRAAAPGRRRAQAVHTTVALTHKLCGPAQADPTRLTRDAQIEDLAAQAGVARRERCQRSRAHKALGLPMGVP